VPVNFGSSIVDFLESYFSTIASSFTFNNQVYFENLDLDPVTFTNNGTLGGFEEITNIGTGGSLGTGSFSYDGTVNSLAVALVVEAPGNITLTGATATQTALFGSTSNVNYTVTDGAASSIFAGGGADSITLYTTNTTMNDTVFSAGADTVNAVGNGSVNLTAVSGADDEVIIQSANVTVTAEGNATVGVHWENPQSGGSIDFINNSTTEATVFSGIFNTSAATPNVTAYGGTGGGYFIGGQRGGAAGANFLVGGAPGSVSVSASGVITQVSADSTAGVSTLVGGADGSIMDAQGFGTGSGVSFANTNAFFAGSGAETMIAASSTDNNIFQIGLKYPGLGQPQSNGVVSTDGAGVQTFYLGNSAGATLYGSTADVGHFANTFNFVSDATAGGGVFTIENFASSNASIYLVDAAGTAAGSASISTLITSPFNSNDVLIGLSDGTQITLKNTSLSDIGTQTLSSGIVQIY
jgi:hypothetical protein